MNRLREYFSSSFLHKLLLLIPAIAFVFWLLPSLFYFAFLAEDTQQIFGAVGVSTTQVHAFIGKQIVGFLIVGVAALLGQVGLTFVVAAHISRPLRRLARIVGTMNPQVGAVPELLDAPPQEMQDETAQLTRAINQFICTVHAYEAKLKAQAHLAAIGETAAMIAHDVRKPIAAMQSLMRVLPQRKNDSAFLEESQRHVEAAIVQTEGMLADILDFSKTVEIDHEAIDPQSLCTSAIGEVLRRFPDADISFVYTLNHTVAIHGDRQRLGRVVSNIIENAVQAMKGNGTIAVRCSEVANYRGVPEIVLQLANTGPMIAAEHLPRLFDPFFTKGKKNGTGLGLAICRRMVEAHGGHMDVTSSIEETVFHLRLPTSPLTQRAPDSERIYHSREITQLLQDTHTGAPPQSTALETYVCSHRARGVTRVLLVDDEPLFRETVRSQLQSMPEVRDTLTIVEADSVESALELLTQQSFTHVVTDLMFGPDRADGYVLVQSLLKNSGATPTQILIHSNRRDVAQDALLAKAPGFAGWLPKPATSDELIRFLAGYDLMPAVVHTAPQPERTVLLLNDDEGLRFALGTELEMLIPGVTVIEAESVDEAIAALDEHTIALVLADINLGKDQPDGYALLTHIRERDIAVRFYFCSGLGASYEAERAANAGAAGYFQIPLCATHHQMILSSLGITLAPAAGNA